jgi:hypothetical protein
LVRVLIVKVTMGTNTIAISLRKAALRARLLAGRLMTLKTIRSSPETCE